MADKEKKDVAKAAPAKETPVAPKHEVPKFSAKELARTSEIRFGVKPEVVKAAFRFYGRDTATIEDAARIIREYRERKVN